MTERKKVISKRIRHRDYDITEEDIANALPVKMPQLTPEQHQARIKKHSSNKDKESFDEGADSDTESRN